MSRSMTASAKRGKSGATTLPRFDLAAQVKTLGADSLLPPKRLTAKQRREFETLIDDVNSHSNGTRVVGRLRMSKFVAEHGKDVCDAEYKRMKR